MLYRVIARFSYTNDNGTVTTTVKQKLMDAGFQRTKTGTFESEAVELSAVKDCFADVLGDLAELDEEGGHLKHLWLYIDGPVDGPDDEIAQALFTNS